MNAKRGIGLLALLVLLCAATMPAVPAHRAFVGEVVDNEVRLKAWYEGGDPINEAPVKVYAADDGKDVLYLEGITDEDGFYSFEPEPGVTAYKVVVEQMGHRAKMNIDLGSSDQPQEAELPLYARIVAGFGYLLGLAGAGMLYASRKGQKGS